MGVDVVGSESEASKQHLERASVDSRAPLQTTISHHLPGDDSIIMNTYFTTYSNTAKVSRSTAPSYTPKSYLTLWTNTWHIFFECRMVVRRISKEIYILTTCPNVSRHIHAWAPGPHISCTDLLPSLAIVTQLRYIYEYCLSCKQIRIIFDLLQISYHGNFAQVQITVGYFRSPGRL